MQFRINISFLTILCIAFLFSPSIQASSISATGGGFLSNVPLGRDSLYETSVVGINTTSEKTAFRFMLAPNHEKFYEPLNNLQWVIPVPETTQAEPGGNTPPLKLLTRFPNEASLYNRRFSASAIVQHVSDGMISLGVALKIRIETAPSREIPKGVRRLAIAPSVLDMNDNIDSILIFNGTNEPETLEVYWARSLNRKDDEEKVIIFKKIFLWEVPIRSIIIEPGKREWVFLKKNPLFDEYVGFIICNGRNNSLYCKIGD